MTFPVIVVTLESRGGGKYIDQFMLQAVSIDSMGKVTVANPGENGVQAFTQVPIEGLAVSTISDCEVRILQGCASNLAVVHEMYSTKDN